MSVIIIVLPKLDNAQNIKRILLTHGFQSAFACSSGASALQMAGQYECGIVLSGYHLSDMYYVELMENLPESYEHYMDAFQFIKDVAVDWDESKYIEAEPGEYITVARKAKNTNNWFVGGITGENARTSTFVLDFLEPGKQYVATLYADGKDADYEKNPTSYQIKKGLVTYKTKISTDLARSGGFAISLIEATPADKKELKKWK